MPNGREIINELDYRQRIKIMGDRELSEFTAFQVYETCIIVQNHGKRIEKMESRDRKTFGYVGGIGGLIGAIIAGTIDFFIRRG